MKRILLLIFSFFLILFGKQIGYEDDYWQEVYRLPEDSVGGFKRLFCSDKGSIFAIYGRPDSETGTPHTCYRSKNNGETWEIIFHSSTMAYLYQWGDKILTSINGKFSYSEDDGDTWVQTHPFDGAYALASIECAHIVKKSYWEVGDLLNVSADSGKTWTTIGFGSDMPPPCIYDVTAGPNGYFYTSVIFRNKDASGTYLSKDKGVTWERISGAPPFRTLQFAKNGYLFGARPYGLYRSTDYGETFEFLPNLNGFIWNFGINNGDYLFASSIQNATSFSYYSSDYGETWIKLPDFYCESDMKSGPYNLCFDKNDHWYRSKGHSIYKSSKTTSIDENNNLVQDFNLKSYPNPFNPSTVISYNLVKPSNVQIKVFNILGQQIWESSAKMQKAGTHSLVFDASRFGSNIYFYRLEVNGEIKDTKKMILIK